MVRKLDQGAIVKDETWPSPVLARAPSENRDLVLENTFPAVSVDQFVLVRAAHITRTP